MIGRRHAQAIIVGRHALNQQAFLWLAWHNGRPVSMGENRLFANIEPQVRLAITFIGAVAPKASVRQDRSHVTIEAGFIGRDGAAR